MMCQVLLDSSNLESPPNSKANESPILTRRHRKVEEAWPPKSVLPGLEYQMLCKITMQFWKKTINATFCALFYFVKAEYCSLEFEKH